MTSGACEHSITVLFLARGVPRGRAAYDDFFLSYDRHPAGAKHELLVVLKGWSDSLVEREISIDVSVRGGACLHLPDDGFDIGAYFRAVERIQTDWVCLLNTNSVINADSWLSKMVAAARNRKAVVGATGSWESGLENAIAALSSAERPMHRRLLALAFGAIWFPRFPNPHLRSNCLLTPTALFRRFADRTRVPVRKRQAHAIESGRWGYSSWVRRQGYELLVVSSDGTPHEISQWKASQTFRSGDLSRTLVIDNQVLGFQQASKEDRLALARAAWG